MSGPIPAPMLSIRLETGGDMTTPVIFRKFKTGELVAFFPENTGNYQAHTCMSYMHLGQHCTADANPYYTKPASPAEYADLLRELVAIGYNDLKIVKRFTLRSLPVPFNWRIKS
jgi:hypothetical protein